EHQVQSPRCTTERGGCALIPSLFFYQLAVLGRLWLFGRLHAAWPSRCALAPHKSAKLIKPLRQRSQEPKGSRGQRCFNRGHAPPSASDFSALELLVRHGERRHDSAEQIFSASRGRRFCQKPHRQRSVQGSKKCYWLAHPT